jgi:hypothetical protein
MYLDKCFRYEFIERQLRTDQQVPVTGECLSLVPNFKELRPVRDRVIGEPYQCHHRWLLGNRSIAAHYRQFNRSRVYPSNSTVSFVLCANPRVSHDDETGRVRPVRLTSNSSSVSTGLWRDGNIRWENLARSECQDALRSRPRSHCVHAESSGTHWGLPGHSVRYAACGHQPLQSDTQPANLAGR